LSEADSSGCSYSLQSTYLTNCQKRKWWKRPSLIQTQAGRRLHCCELHH